MKSNHLYKKSMQKNAVEADGYMVYIFTCSLFNIIICKYEV